ncbi:hypothetical protein GOBAR_DD01200 [Gossypium barbadense]|nr:hypothetical protein GOBAR_DD01200 [Gossypium barbadense]
MARTVIVKLLERRISYLTISNKLQAIWKTKQPLQIIDLENDYFSVKFQEDNEYLDALFKGPWTIFGHYLTVWRWTPAFSTDQVQPQNFMAWIRLLGLSKGMYTKSLLRFIGSVVGSVAKIERNIDNNVRGKFVWLVVYMDLEKPLVSKCGRFGHNRENCPHKTGQGSASEVEVNQQLNRGLRMQRRVEKEEFEPWMLVERKQRRKSRSTRGRNGITDGGVIGGSRFGVLNGNYGGEFWKQSNDLNGNNGSRILGKVYLGINEPVKNARIVEALNKTRRKKKGTSKAKGKRDVTANGPKSNLNTLKPSKKYGGKGNQRPREEIGGKVGENIRWEPASFTSGDSLSLPIALVIDDILQGLSNEVGDDIAMVNVLGKEIEEEDEIIVDVEST